MKISRVLVSSLVALAFVGAGCSSAGGGASGSAAAKSGAEVVEAKLTAAKIQFEKKDRTADVKAKLPDVADAVKVATEFKIAGSSVALSVVDANDGREGIISAKLFGLISDAKAAVAGIDGKVFAFKVNQGTVVSAVFKSSDAATATKVEDSLR